MIAIVNIGPNKNSEPEGECTYELRINSAVIARFRHCRAEGLSACLRLAADEAEKREMLKAAYVEWQANAFNKEEDNAK